MKIRLNELINILSKLFYEMEIIVKGNRANENSWRFLHPPLTITSSKLHALWIAQLLCSI